jgi:hypothetical protein
MHEHDWRLVYSVFDRQVRHCADPKCDAWESLVADLNKKDGSMFSWVPGNLWMHRDMLFVVTGTYEEFQEIASALHKSVDEDIIRLQSISQLEIIEHLPSKPAILVWGTWYEDPIVHDPRFAYLLNIQAG